MRAHEETHNSHSDDDWDAEAMMKGWLPKTESDWITGSNADARLEHIDGTKVSILVMLSFGACRRMWIPVSQTLLDLKD